MQTISLHDTLVIERREAGFSLEVDDPAIPDGPDNLAWRAASALPVPRRGRAGAHVTIRKRIPAGAGLGGGSSDAATALVGLRTLWGLDLSDRRLEAIAADLGADVPFFLHGGTALLTGTGTVVTPLEDLLGYEILVVFPGEPLATREVYARASASLTSSLKISSMPSFRHIVDEGPAREVETWVRAGNDLAAAAASLCPSIARISDHLLTAGATAASMTGSGSAVFGIFRDKDALERGISMMGASGHAASRCEPVGRVEYRRHAGLP